MRAQILNCFFFQKIIVVVLSLAFTAFVFGQNNAERQKCLETDFDCIVAEFTRAINSNPKDEEAYYGRGNALARQEKYEQALKDFDEAVRLNPKFAMAHDGRGFVFIRQRRYAEAVAEFARAREVEPKDSYALGSLELIYKTVKAGDLTIGEYDDLIEVEPNRAELYCGRAFRYFDLKKYEFAVEDATKAVELNPKLDDAYAVRSDAYCRLEKSKESNADISKYESLTGKGTKAFCDACIKKPIDCEIDELTRQLVLEEKKEFPQRLNSLYIERGALYYKKGDYDGALADFNQLKELYFSSQVLKIKGDIYFQRQRYDEALDVLLPYVKIAPSSLETNLKVGKIYFLRREYENAFEYFDKVIFLSSANTEALFARGVIYLERGESYGKTGRDDIKSAEAYRKAVEDFDSVIRKDAKSANRKVYLKRAEAYEKLGETEKAVADRKMYEELTAKPN